ncbi:MAG TPA: lanthionine synthetase LanC family protein, partial [Thermoanaerobaculia bacterium]|nr:lanthionine synthetase LanC family protein [Thermoanaerobaculia bacterium]
MTDPDPNRPEPPWRPLLTGEAADAARAAVDDIAAELAAAPPGEAPAAGRDLSLAGGQAGRALFFAYLDAARPDLGHDEAAMTCLERAIAGTAELPASSGLYSGFAGVAWVLEHLQGRLFDAEGEDPGEEIATVLREHLERSPWRGDYDLISGLVGFGVYALERRPRPGGRECLEEIVARLAETAERRPEGVTWHSAPELIGPYQRETYPEG